MHNNSEQNTLTLLTQFPVKWAKFWCSISILALLCWVLGKVMPWEHPWLYPLQAILLTMPMWVALFLPVWSVVVARFFDVPRVLYWMSMCISILTLTWSLGIWDSSQKITAPSINVLIANVNAYGPKNDQLSKRLSMLNSDYTVLLEKRVEEIEGMTRVVDDFDTPVKRPSHHTAVFCKSECTAWVSPQLGSSTMSMSMAVIPIKHHVCLLAVHIPPPTPIDATGMRPYVEYVESVVQDGRLLRDWEGCKRDDDVIVAGDFNAVPQSWAYTHLLDVGLVDAQRHSGIAGSTWPSDSEDFVRLPLFRIDHVLHSPEIELSVKQIQIPNSDHQGLWITVAQ